MKSTIAFLLVLVAGAAGAQQKLDVAVKHVNDRRTTGSFAQLGITLELPKIGAAEVAGSRVLVTRAVDDTGRDLVDREADEPRLEMNVRMHMAEKPSPATVSVTLRNPDRKAKTVREVAGEIELFLPGRDPNSIAEADGFMPASGKPLAHAALKANGVAITFLTPQQIEAEKKKRADARRSELAELGYDAETIESELAGEMESFASDENEILAYVEDPQGRIEDVTYVDPAGETRLVSLRVEDGIAYFSSWSARPEAGWKLRVTMRTAKNLVRYPFAVKDVALP